LQCELNCFYLKYLVWIPPEHPLLTYRLILVFFFALPATREAYQYLVDKYEFLIHSIQPPCKHAVNNLWSSRNTKRFGPHAWTILANIFTETLICIKYGRGEFPEPAPFPVVVFWIVFSTSLFLYTVWKFWWLPRARKQKANGIKKAQ
jgi:phosphatidylserine synthase 2